MSEDINGVTLRNTCGACPEQYDAYIGREQVGFLRLRHGSFYVAVPDHTGTVVYEAEPNGDGMFEAEERDRYLGEAVLAILKHRALAATQTEERL